MPGRDNGWRWRELVGLALLALLLIALWRVPAIGWLAYPLRLFGTFVHELCHGAAAVISGGEFRRFTVAPDLSGLAWTAGGSRWLVISAGYIGSAVFGGLLIMLSGWGLPSRFLLGAMGALLALACVILAGNAFGMLAGLAIAAVLLTAAIWLSTVLADALLLVLALQSVLDGFNSLLNLFHLTTRADVHSDAHNMANLTGLPAGLWVAIWLATAAVILLLALRLSWLRIDTNPPSHESPKPS